MRFRALPRDLLAFVIVASAALAPWGCAPTSPPKQKVALGASSADAVHRTVSMMPMRDGGRPSESTPVTEDKADPEAARLFQARMGQAAVPLAETTTPPRVTEIRLDDTRRGEAPDMQPAGAIFAATLTEGQRATMPVHLAPGACETFIAQGGLGVVEVDLFITTSDASRILAEDKETGPIAVIGGNGKCFAGAPGTGTEGLLHAAVRRGAGVVLVRAYKK
jgi:hypothetical protein